MIEFVTPYEKLLDRAVQQYHLLNFEHLTLKTGTSIVAFACEEGIVMASDLQATLGPMKVEIECKILDLIWCDKDKYLVGLAGIGQIITFVVSSCNEFYNVYRSQFLRTPSVDNIVQYLRILHNRTGWNNYGHVIIGGACSKLDKYVVSSLRYGDYQTINKKCKYLSIGSGSIYLNAVIDSNLNSLNTLKKCTKLAKDSLKIAMQTDLYSGIAMQIYTLVKGKKIDIEEIRFDKR